MGGYTLKKFGRVRASSDLAVSGTIRVNIIATVIALIRPPLTVLTGIRLSVFGAVIFRSSVASIGKLPSLLMR